MKLPEISFEFLRTIPIVQKVLVLVLLMAGVVAGFYYTVWDEKKMKIEEVQGQIVALDAEIQTLTVKTKHLEELMAANKQLERDLEKKKEVLPPEEEAVLLLRQLTEVGTKLGLDIRLWKPGARAEDASKLYVKLPVTVEVTGGYHTAALFFDRVNNFPRIINVSNLSMGNPKIEQDRVVIQTNFELTAFVAPPEIKPAAPPAPGAAAAPAAVPAKAK